MNERYTVQKAAGRGYDIIDTTGQDKPYHIDAAGSFDGDELARLTPADLESYEAQSQRVAEHWRTIWNRVEAGFCGSCGKPTPPGEGYASVGWNSLYKRVCFSCACSQED